MNEVSKHAHRNGSLSVPSSNGEMGRPMNRTAEYFDALETPRTNDGNELKDYLREHYARKMNAKGPYTALSPTFQSNFSNRLRINTNQQAEQRKATKKSRQSPVHKVPMLVAKPQEPAANSVYRADAFRAALSSPHIDPTLYMSPFEKYRFESPTLTPSFANFNQHPETIFNQHPETIFNQHPETIFNQHPETIFNQHPETIFNQHLEIHRTPVSSAPFSSTVGRLHSHGYGDHALLKIAPPSFEELDFALLPFLFGTMDTGKQDFTYPPTGFNALCGNGDLATWNDATDAFFSNRGDSRNN